MAKQTLDETKMLKTLLSHIKALRDTIQDILNNQQAAEHSRYVAYKSMAQTYNDLVEQAKVFIKIPSLIYTFKVEEMSGFGATVWPMQKQILEQVLVSTKMLYSSLESTIDFADDEFDNIENFLKSRLRTVIFDKPEKGIEVQNAIESLLIGRGLSKGTDYDREAGKLEFSGKEYIPDFIIPKLHLCIEVKLLREGKKSRIIGEISSDITAYRKEYGRQLFIVYDLGYIQNEEEFRRDIENSGNVKVIVVKH